MTDNEATRVSVGKYAVEAPIPRWALVPLSFLVVFLAASGLFLYFYYPPGMADQINEMKRRQVVQRREQDEYAKHIGEDPERVETLFEDARGRLKLTLYSDRCLLPTFRMPDGRVYGHLVMDLSREPGRDSPPEPSAPLSFNILPVAYAQGQCVDHSRDAPFRWWAVPRAPCWIEYQREYDGQGGCLQSQMLDSCDNIWQNPVWLRCVH